MGCGGHDCTDEQQTAIVLATTATDYPDALSFFALQTYSHPAPPHHHTPTTTTATVATTAAAAATKRTAPSIFFNALHDHAHPRTITMTTSWAA